MNDFWRALIDSDNIREVENAFDLEADYIFDLYLEDDWIMVVKSHAIIETVANYAISMRFKAKVANVPIDYSGLDKFVSRLEMSNTKFGKLALLKIYDLIDDDYIKRMQSLSELRNKSVHDIRGIALNINNSVSQMSADEFSVFKKRWITPSSLPRDEVCDVDDDAILADPKGFIHACTCDIIADIWSYSQGMVGLIELDDLVKAFALKQLNLLKGENGESQTSE